MEKEIFKIESVRFNKDCSAMVILDQTLLPNKVKYLTLTKQEAIWQAIYKLQVRGAPAIGIAGAMGLYLGINHLQTDDFDTFFKELVKIKEYLNSSRPTAVNLSWALSRMENCAKANKDKPIEQIKETLRIEATAILDEDIASCKSIGQYGSDLIKDGMGILTHCNAGTLATSKYGTALSPIYIAAEEKGYSNLRVFCDETRPLLQGARLTAFELVSAGIDTTLICDNMASIVMKNGWIDACFVGCDRVAANGDTANKIGTSGVAILAKNYGIPFYVCGPTSTIDLNAATGKDIPIELRKGEEISRMWYKTPMAPENVKLYNPAFDVTDNKFITGIVTEYGIALPPFEKSLKEILAKKSAK